MTGDGFFGDGEKLDYPRAERLVVQYITQKQTQRTTTVAVLEWSEYPNTHHNRHRVFGALERVAEPSDSNWRGRTVFELPDEV